MVTYTTPDRQSGFDRKNESANQLEKRKFTARCQPENEFESLRLAFGAYRLKLRRTEQIDGPVSYLIMGANSADRVNSLTDLRRYLEQMESESIQSKFDELRAKFKDYGLLLQRTDRRDGPLMYWVEASNFAQVLRTITDANRFLEQVMNVLKGKSEGNRDD